MAHPAIAVAEVVQKAGAAKEVEAIQAEVSKEVGKVVEREVEKEIGEDALSELPQEIGEDSLKELPKELENEANSDLSNKVETEITADKKDNYWFEEKESSEEMETEIKETKSEDAEKTERNESNSNDVKDIQEKCIAEAEKNTNLDDLDSQVKGNYAEMKVDRDLASKGYDRISKECVTDLTSNTGPGIDGVFVNRESGKVLITETKFNKSELGSTLDGKQMGDAWIDKRLDASVGKDTADAIRMEKILNPDNVESVLAKVDLDGNISYFKLDANAKIVGGIDL